MECIRCRREREFWQLRKAFERMNMKPAYVCVESKECMQIAKDLNYIGLGGR